MTVAVAAFGATIFATILGATPANAKSRRQQEAKAAEHADDEDDSDANAKTAASASEAAPQKASEKTSDKDTPSPIPPVSTEESTPTPTPTPPSPEPTKAPPAPLLAWTPGWQMGFFGWLELDAMSDSTQSFTESVLNSNISRPHTIAGDNPRFQATAKDSRLGYKLVSPQFGSLKASAFMEADFFGVLPTTATQDQSYTYASIRLRQYYAKLETPIVDLLVGQTFDLYGMGGQGFFPSTPAFLGVMGEVFHRNVQLRLTKVFGAGSPVGLELAAAGVRPATRDSGVPDVQAGLKFNLNAWKGASAQGPRPAKVAPLSIGVSGVGRRLTVTDFENVTADPQTVYGWGVAIDAFLPIIPARGDDLSNTLSVTGEVSAGTGVTDLYLTLNGGVLFPSLPNPKNILPAPSYTPNIDPGIVTFDATGAAKTLQWEGLMVNAHYHFPFGAGKVLALSGTYSMVQSNNALSLTPVQGRAFVWDKGRYVDGTLWWAITPAFQMAVSYQTMAQTYGDGTLARNNRTEASWWFFF